jgi:hypothetical protein
VCERESSSVLNSHERVVVVLVPVMRPVSCHVADDLKFNIYIYICGLCTSTTILLVEPSLEGESMCMTSREWDRCGV